MLAIKPHHIRPVNLLLLQLFIIAHFIQASPLNHHPTQPVLSLPDSHLEKSVKSTRQLPTARSQNPLLIRRSNPSGYPDDANIIRMFAGAGNVRVPAEAAPEDLLIPAQAIQREPVASGPALRLRPGDEVPEQILPGEASRLLSEGEQVPSGHALMLPPQDQPSARQEETRVLRENQLSVLRQIPPARREDKSTLPDKSHTAPRR